MNAMMNGKSLLFVSINLVFLLLLVNVGEAKKISDGKAKQVTDEKSCFIHARVQKVAVKECSDQLIKLPICVGACSTSESLYVNGVDVTRIKSGANSACSCCRPVEFKVIKKRVPCYKLFYKVIELKIPVKCECDTTCSLPKDGVDQKSEIERKDFLTNSKGMPEGRRSLYNILLKV